MIVQFTLSRAALHQFLTEGKKRSKFEEYLFRHFSILPHLVRSTICYSSLSTKRSVNQDAINIRPVWEDSTEGAGPMDRAAYGLQATSWDQCQDPVWKGNTFNRFSKVQLIKIICYSKVFKLGHRKYIYLQRQSFCVIAKVISTLCNF